MTTTFQISDKIGDAIFVVKSENADPQQAYGEFAAALAAVGNHEAENTLRRLGEVLVRQGAPAPVSTVGDPLAAAQAAVQAAFPGAQVVSAPPAQQPWGNPPVPPFQPGTAPQAAPPQYAPPQQQYQQPAPQVPGAAAPQCQHGTKLYKDGFGKEPPHRPWAAWFCPAPQSDPTRCAKDWIR